MANMRGKVKWLAIHPLAKRVSIAIPLGVAFGLIWVWLGFEQAPLERPPA